MSGTTFDAVAEQSFIRDALAKIWRRKWQVFFISVNLFWMIGLSIQFLPKSYQGIARVAVEQTPNAVATGEVIRDMPFDPDVTMGTELEILKSWELMSETVRRNNLTANPEFNPHLQTGAMVDAKRWVRTKLYEWLKIGSIDKGDREFDDTLATLLKHLKMAPVSHSRVIQITATSHDNETAAAIANTIVDLYLAHHLNVKQNVSAQAHDFIDARLTKLREASGASAHAAEEFRIKHGLNQAQNSTVTQEQVTAVNEQLATARNRLTALESQYAAGQHANPEQLTAVLGSQTISRLREQESQIGAKRAALVSSYGEESSLITPLNAQLGAIRRQIAVEAMRAVQSLPAEIRAAQGTVDTLMKRLAELNMQMAQMSLARAELTKLEDESNAARKVYVDFITRSNETDASVLFPATPLRIISRAALERRPSFPNNLLMLPAAFILSWMFGCMFAYVAESRRKGLVSTEEIETLQIRPLGMLPTRTPQTEDLYQDAIENLLNRILFNRSTRTILVTSVFPSEGKSTTALALAQAASNRGKRVLLIDADLRAGRAQRSASVGLGDVLRGTARPEDAIVNSHGTHLLLAGTARGNPTRLLSLPTLEAMLMNMQAQYDLIFLDAPPILIGGDCWLMAQHANQIALIVRWEATSPEQVRVAVKQLVPEPEKLGLVLNMVDPKRSRKLGYSDAILLAPQLYKDYHRRHGQS